MSLVFCMDRYLCNYPRMPNAQLLTIHLANYNK